MGDEGRRPRGQLLPAVLPPGGLCGRPSSSEMCQLPTHACVSLGFHVSADAGGDIFGHAPLMDSVLADWAGEKKVVSITPPARALPPPRSPQAPTMTGTSPSSPGCWDGVGADGLGVQESGKGPRLTGAAEALLADPQQHCAAEVTVGGFLEVLQPPGVLPIVLHVL